MNAFVRQLAVLSVLWSLCELLLPDGRQQRMARMTVSVLVMAALISAVSGLLGTQAHLGGLPAMAQTVGEAAGESYARIALTSAANQLEGLCVRLAERAGYQARAAVYLREDGPVELIRLWLTPDETRVPLLDGEALRQAIAEHVGVDPVVIALMDGADGA